MLTNNPSDYTSFASYVQPGPPKGELDSERRFQLDQRELREWVRRDAFAQDSKPRADFEHAIVGGELCSVDDAICHRHLHEKILTAGFPRADSNGGQRGAGAQRAVLAGAQGADSSG
jgi:hypothetical protein